MSDPGYRNAMKAAEDCNHWETTNVVYFEGIQEICNDCGSTRDGYIAWGEWSFEE